MQSLPRSARLQIRGPADTRSFRGLALRLFGLVLAMGLVQAKAAETPALAPGDLRLIPFPKQVQILPGGLTLRPSMTIAFSEAPATQQAGQDLKEELARIAPIEAAITDLPAGDGPVGPWLCLSAKPIPPDRVRSATSSIFTRAQSYRLVVGPEFAAVGAGDEAGLVWGVQTLRQLIRANLRNNMLPAVAIEDWPCLEYRGWSNDITRGLSPKMETFKRQIRLTSLLKMNLYTWYMEYAFAFTKHPKIGPKDGSFTPQELRALVQYAKPYKVEIVGNQQSFGHYGRILAMDEYKHLAEASDVLNPTIEDTYEFLDDLFSDQVPLTESKFFNVCCDETWKLGTGPSKPLADKIGIGGVYVGHIKRLHDLLKNKYNKRMLMWADIITKYPKNLADIPKDTIVIPWAYWPSSSYDNVIAPIAKSGFDFMVLPGVCCWRWILPAFDTAVINIQVMTRDGIKHGAFGMINSTWDDRGENFDAYNWHGLAWGAECAWTGSATDIKDFNRRLGPVLFGEQEDHFGRAITLLTKTHKLDGYDDMIDPRFWNTDIPKGADKPTVVRQAYELLAYTKPALEYLAMTKTQAKVNAGLLDYFIFGTERMQLLATRMLDLLEAAHAYEQAQASVTDRQKATRLVKQAQAIVKNLRDQHTALKPRYEALWNREAKPYNLDRIQERFDTLIAHYDDKVDKLQSALAILEQKGTLPPAQDVGLVAP